MKRAHRRIAGAAVGALTLLVSLLIALPARGETLPPVGGVVTDLGTGDPIAGACVDLFNVVSHVQEACTGGDGRYAFDVLSTFTSVRLRVTAPGYGEMWAPDAPDFANATVSSLAAGPIAQNFALRTTPCTGDSCPPSCSSWSLGQPVCSATADDGLPACWYAGPTRMSSSPGRADPLRPCRRRRPSRSYPARPTRAETTLELQWAGQRLNDATAAIHSQGCRRSHRYGWSTPPTTAPGVDGASALPVHVCRVQPGLTRGRSRATNDLVTAVSSTT